MKLALGHIESTTLFDCRVRYFSQPQPIDARYSELMLAAGTWSRRGQLVVVDLDTTPPPVFYHRSDITVQATGKGSVIGGADA